MDSEEFTHEIKHLVNSTQDLCLWNTENETRDYYYPCINTRCCDCEHNITIFTN